MFFLITARKEPELQGLLEKVRKYDGNEMLRSVKPFFSHRDPIIEAAEKVTDEDWKLDLSTIRQPMLFGEGARKIASEITTFAHQ